MEDLLHKAVEKAKHQRKELKGARQKIPAGEAALPTVVYEQTRVEPVSSSRLRNKRIVAGFAHDPNADVFRVLRAQVLKFLKECSGSTVGICSPNPGEGKSVIAINLAVSLALDVNHTVLLADVDLRRPSLQAIFALPSAPGLSDFLLRDATIPECLVNPGVDRLVLLPAGAAAHNSSEALASPRMSDLTAELKSRYPDRLVIYNLPPLLPSDDALVLLKQVDACILVVEDGKTREGEIQRALDFLSDYNLVGAVLNKSENTDSYYYHT